MYDIIAVDDSQEIRSLLGLIFEDTEWDVGIFEHPEEALAAMANNTPRLVMTDINMPSMDGLTLAAKVRKKFPNLPIIALTASAEEGELDTKNLSAVLHKPFKIDYLLNHLKKYLRPEQVL